MKKQVAKFKLGDEYLYEPNHSTGPIYLTFIENVKDEWGLFFSSEFPSLDYVVKKCNLTYPSRDVPHPRIAEHIIAFRGKDKKKEKAYKLFLERRNRENANVQD